MIALITPTGGRPKQIELCAKYMKRQDFEGEVLWIIIDDCDPSTIDFIKEDFRPGWKIVKIYPAFKWKLGYNTQAHNLLAGIAEVKKYKDIELIYIIEDDDYYTSRYLRIMHSSIDSYNVIGEQCTIYYNIARQAWNRCTNTTHSSLFQTAFKPSMIGQFEKVCRRQTKFIDMAFYRQFVPRETIKFLSKQQLSIGIKGLPGRPGIGIGHNLTHTMTEDPGLLKLKELIGDDYLNYYEWTNTNNRN